MKRITFIDLGGRAVLFLNFADLKDIEEIRMTAGEGKETVRQQGINNLITLTDITGMHFNNSIKDIFQDLASHNKPYVSMGAVAGITGLNRILYNGLMKITGRNLKGFQTLQDARDWLINNS